MAHTRSRGALRRAQETGTLSYRTVVELNAESRLAPQRRVVTIARRPERAQRLAAERAGRSERHQLQRLTPPTGPTDDPAWDCSRTCCRVPGRGTFPVSVAV